MERPFHIYKTKVMISLIFFNILLSPCHNAPPEMVMRQSRTESQRTIKAVDSTRPKFMICVAIFRGFWRPENMMDASILQSQSQWQSCICWVSCSAELAMDLVLNWPNRSAWKLKPRELQHDLDMVALRKRTGQSALSTRRSAPSKLSGRIGTYRGQLLKVFGMAEARSAGD